MHITNVSTKSLKGRTQTVALTKKTVIVGPNFSGKTAILDAIRLGLKGHIPEVGARNAATFDLSSGTSMGVTLDIEGFGQVSRSLTLRNGTVSLTSSPNLEDNEFDTPMLDAAAYFAMTERERIDYVFRHVTMPESMTPSGIVARLERLGFGDEHSTKIEDAKRDVLETIRPEFEGETSVADALTTLTNDILPAEFTAANRRVKDMEGAARALAEIKTAAGAVTADTLTDLRNELEQTQTKAGEASKELGRLESRQAESKRVAERQKGIVAQLAASGPEFLTLPPAPENAERITRAEERLKQIGTLVVIERPTQTKLEASRTAYANAASEAARLTIVKQKLEHELEEVKHLKECPHCGGKAKGWNKNLLASVTTRLEEAVAAEKAAIDKLEPLALAGRTEKAAYDEAVTKYNDYCSLTGEVQSLTREVERWKAEENGYGALVDQTNKSNDQIKQRHAARMTELNAELETLQAVEPPTESELAAAQSAAADLRSRLAALNDRIGKGERLQRELQVAQETSDRYELAAAKVTVLNAFKKELTEVKGELVAAAFQALLETANEIVGDILPSPLAFNDETSEVGRWGPSGFISHKTFSGTEKALAYVAVAAALASKAKLRVLPLDELGRLTEDLQDKVLEALSKAVDAGKLDQVIAVIPLTADQAEHYPTGFGIEAAKCYTIINTVAP